MRINKLLLIGLIFLVGCDYPQNNRPKKIYGYDFALFEKTPVRKLAEAVKEQDVGTIKHFCSSHKSVVDYQEKQYGETLLMLAAMHGLNNSIKALLECGANPDLVSDITHESAFMIVCNKNNYKCNPTAVRLMIANGADVNLIRSDHTTYNGMTNNVEETPLMIAAEANCLETLKILLDNGADPNVYPYPDSPGYGVLTSAIIQDNINIVKYLVVEKHIKIPKFVRERKMKDGTIKRLSLSEYLNEKEYHPGSDNYRLRKEIIDYLEK